MDSRVDLDIGHVTLPSLEAWSRCDTLQALFSFLLGNFNDLDLQYSIKYTLPSHPTIPRWSLHAHGSNGNWSGNIVDVGMVVLRT